MILFCLPYAGGSEAIYYKWRNYLETSIKLHTIELKGRGKRFNESFYKNFDDGVEDILNIIKNKLFKENYAIFGHSMGSLLAYELYYKICEMNFRKPSHMFFSAYRAPSIGKSKENIHALPDKDFMNKILDLGGTPEEIINNNELLEIFIPILRNDFKILETYHYAKKIKKIECNISVFGGKQDSINLRELEAWRNHSSGECKIYTFEGNHFFINDNAKNVINVINETLC